MKKFTFVYMGVLALFIIVGVGMIIFSEKDDGTLEIDKEQLENTPGLSTMLDIQQIIVDQQLQDYLIDINVAKENKKDVVTVKLQGNDFVTSDTLLKDSYNIFTQSSTLSQITNLHIIWYVALNGTNEEVLSIEMDQPQMKLLSEKSYSEISNIATKYVKHENFQ